MVYGDGGDGGGGGVFCYLFGFCIGSDRVMLLGQKTAVWDVLVACGLVVCLSTCLSS
jgi:hypothetical protein